MKIINLKTICSTIILITLFFPWYKMSEAWTGITINKIGFETLWGFLIFLSAGGAVAMDFIEDTKAYSKYVSLAPVLFAIIAAVTALGLSGEFLSIHYGISWGVILSLIATVVNAIAFFIINNEK